MFPYLFDYLDPSSLAETITHLVERQDEDVKILAGGQSLIPLMKLRFAQPGCLVDLNGVPDLSLVREDAGWVRIGALTRESQLEASVLLRRRVPALLDTAAVIADPIVRNLATIGGNLAHGDPANDHPATMIALGASVVAEGPQGERVIPVEDFFLGLFETRLEPAEVLTEIRVPSPPPDAGAAYVKFERQVGDFAIVGAAAYLRVTDGAIAEARLALTNVGMTPYRPREAEQVLVGEPGGEEVFRGAGERAAAGIEVTDDVRGTARYKRRVATAVTARALHTAFARAQEVAG